MLRATERARTWPATSTRSRGPRLAGRMRSRGILPGATPFKSVDPPRKKKTVIKYEVLKQLAARDLLCRASSLGLGCAASTCRLSRGPVPPFHGRARIRSR